MTCLSLAALFNRRRLLSLCLLALPCGLLPMLSGCNAAGAVGVATYKIFGPPAVDPVHVLGPEPVLVMVENYRNPVGASADAEEVTRYVVENLQKNLKVDKDKPPQIRVIDPDKLLELQNERPAEYAKMKIPQVGKALGAKQVLYVDLMVSGVDMTQGSELLRGRFVARVKVVDVATGQNRWPNDMAEGFPVSWESKPQRPSDKVNPPAVRERALSVGSEYISRLFYKWKPDDSMDDDQLQAAPEL